MELSAQMGKGIPQATMVGTVWCVILLLAASVSLPGGGGSGQLRAEDLYFEQNGILFREQRVVERKPVAQWQWVERQEVAYHEEFTTTFREEQRVVQVPVVVANSAGGPPVTRWEARTQIVRSPVVVRQLVPETRTVRVPVRQLGFVAEERVARVPLGPAPTTTTAAAPRPWNGMSTSGYDTTSGRW